MVPDSVKIGKNCDGKQTGIATCKFETEESCKLALNKKQGQYMGNRWIELLQITEEEYDLFEQDQRDRITLRLS